MQRTTIYGVTTALIYTRVSSDEQAREGVSLDAQLSECRKYAARQGWMLGEEYQDVLSGKRDDRPAYQRLLSDVRRQRGEGKALVVVVAALDRLGRRILERVRSREELQALGVQTHSVREGGEVSDLTANVLAAVAEEETRRLGERVGASLRHFQAGGWHIASKPPWGYRWREASPEERDAGSPRIVLDEDPDTAPYVREAFERVAAGESVRSVGAWATTLPERARGGRSLPFTAFRLVLSREVYAPAETRRWPEIVDATTWRLVQERIALHRRIPKQASGRYLLTGLLRCAVCGARMGGIIPTDRAPKYRCNARDLASHSARAPQHTILLEPVESAVRLEVGRVLGAVGADPMRGALSRAWSALQAPGRGEQDARRRARLELDLERARKRLGDAAIKLVDGTLDRAGYEAARSQVEADLRATEEELARLDAAAPPPATLPPLSDVLASVATWAETLASVDTAAQRDVLALLIERVEAKRTGHARYDVQITWTPLGEALRRLADAGTC